MKKYVVVGEQLCRTFTTAALAAETNNTIATVDIMEYKRTLAAVRIAFMI